MNVRIECRFTLRSPLTHIGEVISTTAYLVEEPIRQPSGDIEPVFCYSGNAWRGQLRDLIADYFLDGVGSPTISLDAFHLLYSGGAIGGTQTTNLAHARAYRRMITPVALLGGGIGNQILPGKLRVSNFYPVCDETAHLQPNWIRERQSGSYRGMSFEKSFSRKDDSKDDRLNHRMLPPPETATQATMLGDVEPEKPTKRAGEAAQQMRMTVELLAAGVELFGHLDLLDAIPEELGCLVSGLHRFSRSPHIGGQAQRGHGLVALETRMLDLDTGELIDPFVTVKDRCLLAPEATQAKDAYDQHLRTLYDALLEQNQPEVVKMLGAA